MLTRINSNFYNYIDSETGFQFSLRYGKIGVLSYGRCWRLILTANQHETTIACFVTEDDGHRCYNDTCEHRIWNKNEIVSAAENMIQLMLGRNDDRISTVTLSDNAADIVNRISNSIGLSPSAVASKIIECAERNGNTRSIEHND